MKKYKYILLDWDGNLAKTLDIWLEAYGVVLREHGLKLSDREIAASFGEVRKHLDEWGIHDDNQNSVIKSADTLAKMILPDVELYPDALAVLEALHQKGKKIALITTSIGANINPVLEKHNLTHFFNVVITYEDTVLHKPYPDPLEKALDMMGGNKEQAVMIGDTEKDIKAAANAGIDNILFYPPEHKKFYDIRHLKSHKPTFIVKDFKEVLDIVCTEHI